MIYCFDLDGTLLTECGGRYLDVRPISERVEKLRDLYRSGQDLVIIQTARGKQWTEFTRQQLKHFDIPYHHLSVGEKVAADIYIDDKGTNDKDFFNAH